MINIPHQTKPNCKIIINAKISKIKKELIKEIIYLTLEKEKLDNKNLIIEIINTREDQIKELNQKYLSKDEATDIISIKNEKNKKIIKNDTCILGSIFICSKIIKQKSIDLNKDELQHLIHLIIHGTLHLLGYNHDKQEERIIMQQKEINILSKLGITSPY